MGNERWQPRWPEKYHHLRLTCKERKRTVVESCGKTKANDQIGTSMAEFSEVKTNGKARNTKIDKNTWKGRKVKLSDDRLIERIRPCCRN